MNDYYAARTRARSRSAGASFLGFLEKLDPAMAERLRFLSAFLREPARVGSFAPSSPALAQAMLHGCELRSARTVVEFGPGTGAFTRLIVERIGGHATFVALELDDKHVRELRQRFPGVHVYRDSAERVQIPRRPPAEESGLHHQRPAVGKHAGERAGAHSRS